jgi:hypothetical protein
MVMSFVGSGNAHHAQAIWSSASPTACRNASDCGSDGIGNKIASTAKRKHITARILNVILITVSHHQPNDLSHAGFVM